MYCNVNNMISCNIFVVEIPIQGKSQAGDRTIQRIAYGTWSSKKCFVNRF